MGTLTNSGKLIEKIESKQDELTAGEGIEIGAIQDYSAMRGPAPDGFHVPLNTEWQTVYDIWTALGGGSSDGTNFGIALKLPCAGSRRNYNSSVYGQGFQGFYWSSSPYPSNASNSYHLAFFSTNINPQYNSYRALGYSVRCFKDTPIIPTSSWTKLYGTSIEAGGIFWSSTDGLISLSSDGTTWITIQDKNLGATTVWNNGDTLSEANGGKYYQWGNNYGFAWTGSLTTSGTQVDASNYGPGNYYSSSTFITGNNDRSSVQNDNLWGGVTGIVTLNNAITNTGVTSVNGQTGDVTITIPEESNVKAFYLEDLTDYTTALEAVNWADSGKVPIVVYGGSPFMFFHSISGIYYFMSDSIDTVTNNSYSTTSIRGLIMQVSGGSVTSITQGSGHFPVNYLSTGANYSTPYTPQYPGSPATKKYVDDNLAAINGISTTQPSNPSAGAIYYDTTDNITKIHNGTSREQLPTSDSVQSIIGANVAGYSSSSIGGSYRESNTTDYLLFTAPVSSTFFFMYTWSQNRSASLKFVTGSGTEYTPPQSTSGNNFYMITLNEGDTLYARIYVGGNGNYSASGYLTSYVVFGPS